MIKFDLRLNPETVEQIKQAADKDSRTVSAMARKILEDYFKDDITNSSITVDGNKLVILTKRK